jgi:predicted nucleotidyltransferase
LINTGISHLSVKSEEIEAEIVRVKPSSAFRLYRDEIRRLVQQSRASNPRVFGSVLRGGDTESSDLDILVDPLPGATLFDLGGLQIALQGLLGVPVDLLTPGDLPHRARERVLREAVPV